MPPIESPLNRLADALPGFLSQMQDIKLRQQAQESLTKYRMGVLANQVEANEIRRDAQEAATALGATERNRERRANMLQLEDEREGGAAAVYGTEQVRTDFPRGIPASRKLEEPKETKDPKEAVIVGRRIEDDRKIVLKPVAEVDPQEVTAARARIRSDAGEYRRLTGRDYPIGEEFKSPLEPEPDTPRPPLVDDTPAAASIFGGGALETSTGIPLGQPAVPDVTPDTGAQQAYYDETAGVWKNAATGEPIQ